MTANVDICLAQKQFQLSCTLLMEWMWLIYSQNSDGRLKARIKHATSTLGCKHAADIQEWALKDTSGESSVASKKSYTFNCRESGFTVTGAEDTISLPPLILLHFPLHFFSVKIP